MGLDEYNNEVNRRRHVTAGKKLELTREEAKFLSHRERLQQKESELKEAEEDLSTAKTDLQEINKNGQKLRDEFVEALEKKKKIKEEELRQLRNDHSAETALVKPQLKAKLKETRQHHLDASLGFDPEKEPAMHWLFVVDGSRP